MIKKVVFKKIKFYNINPKGFDKYIKKKVYLFSLQVLL